MSFEGDQEVFTSSYLSSGQISLQWLASRLGVPVRCYPVWLRARTVRDVSCRLYVSNVRQTSCIRYVDVLHVILPSDAQYLTLASHMKILQPADIICQQGPCVGTVQQNLKNTGLVKSQFGVQTQSLLLPTTLRGHKEVRWQLYGSWSIVSCASFLLNFHILVKSKIIPEVHLRNQKNEFCKCALMLF